LAPPRFAPPLRGAVSPEPWGGVEA